MTAPQKPVLLTGASGNLGRVLAKAKRPLVVHMRSESDRVLEAVAEAKPVPTERTELAPPEPAAREFPPRPGICRARRRTLRAGRCRPSGSDRTRGPRRGPR